MATNGHAKTAFGRRTRRLHNSAGRQPRVLHVGHRRQLPAGQLQHLLPEGHERQLPAGQLLRVLPEDHGRQLLAGQLQRVLPEGHGRRPGPTGHLKVKQQR